MKKTRIIGLSLFACCFLAFILIYTNHIRQDNTAVTDYANEAAEKEDINDTEADTEAIESDDATIPASDSNDTQNPIPDDSKTDAAAEEREEILPQKYLFLGDSTSTCYEDRDNKPVTSYVSYLSEMRTSQIDCRAIVESTYSNIRPNNVLSQMEGVNLSDYDAVFMLFGVNDYIICDDYENTETTDPETMGGALLTAIYRCKEAGVKCYVILPYPCADQFIDGTDAVGNHFQSYVDTIKIICENNDIEMIDFHTQLGVTKENFKEYYIDSFHPNSKLHKKAAEYLNEYLGEDSGVDPEK